MTDQPKAPGRVARIWPQVFNSVDPQDGTPCYIDADRVAALVEAAEKWLKAYDEPRRGSDFANGAKRMRTALAALKEQGDG